MSSSLLLDKLIKALQIMPGIGPVSATRIAYNLLDRKKDEGLELANTLEEALTQISLCPHCRNYTDFKDRLCSICDSFKREDNKTICIVESPTDVEAIEASSSFNGTYFVLHGRLSPIDGIGPNELGLNALKQRFENEQIAEIILALSQTVEGEVTASYIASMAKKFNIKVSRIAQGVPLGGDIGSVDGNTIALSFDYRREI